MQEEKIIKGYDPEIIRKLLPFLKPYKVWIIIAIIALLLSTIGELLLPVILQKTIDNHIRISYYKTDIKDKDRLKDLGIKFDNGEININNDIYITNSQALLISESIRKALYLDNVIGETEYYVFPINNESLTVVVENNKEYIFTDNDYGIIFSKDFEQLTEEDKKIIREIDINAISVAALLFLGILLCILAFSFIQIFFMAFTGQEVMKDVRLKLFDHTINQSSEYLLRNPIGRLVTRITSDVETINELFTNVATSLLKDVCLIVGVIITLFLLDSKLALFTVISFPPVLIIIIIFKNFARNAYRKVRKWVSEINTFLSEHLSGMAIVQMFSNEKESNKKFKKTNRKLFKSYISEMYVMAIFRPMMDLFASISTAVIIYASAYFILKELITLGILVAFINLVIKFYNPVKDIAEKFTIFQSAMAGGERIFHLFSEDTRIPETGKKDFIENNFKNIHNIKGSIEFDNVDFSYRKDEPILRKLSFSVKPGETVAVVGYTGAGKTTIINLLTRLWDLDSGKIRIDGQNIQDFPKNELRKVVQPVLQDVFLFNGTIEENIKLGSDITSEKVKMAAKIVQADSFISKMPEKYKTILNEGATNISTGQRQLLSFARVIAHDPRIIVLDEATGNIDTETEKLIQKAMDELLESRTAIVIAHRLSTIKHADRIFVLSHGELVEHGTHQELLAKKELYYNLYKLQYEKLNNE